MTVADIFIKVLDEEMTYEEASVKIDENTNLDKAEKEKYKKRLRKLEEKFPVYNMEQQYQLNGIPSDMYFKILSETIHMVRTGLNTSDIAQRLYNSYRINSYMIQYFVNESLHIYRMNTFTEDEFNMIGSQYMDIVAKIAGINPKEMKHPKVKFADKDDPDNPAAEEINEFKETEEGVEFE